MVLTRAILFQFCFMKRRVGHLDYTTLANFRPRLPEAIALSKASIRTMAVRAVQAKSRPSATQAR